MVRALQQVTQAMGIDEGVTAPRSRWQNPFVERVIGTLRRECLDHVIVWNERVAPPPQAVPRLLSRMANAPLPGEGCARPAGGTAATCGTIVQVLHVSGLHHHYERRAA